MSRVLHSETQNYEGDASHGSRSGRYVATELHVV